jgi:hypothetical protein
MYVENEIEKKIKSVMFDYDKIDANDDINLNFYDIG